MTEYVVPTPPMTALLVKLGDPSDCTLCGFWVPLTQCEVTVLPIATVPSGLERLDVAQMWQRSGEDGQV